MSIASGKMLQQQTQINALNSFTMRNNSTQNRAKTGFWCRITRLNIIV